MFFLSDEMPFSFDEMLLFGAASGGKLVEDTATGNPLTFTTDVAKALKSLTIPFLPVQSGTGDPSPENIRSIVPWDGLTVWNGGKNRFDLSTVVSGTLNGQGALVPNASRTTSDFILLTAGTYIVSRATRPDWWKAWKYTTAGEPIAEAFNNNGSTSKITVSETCLIRLSFDYIVNAENCVQLEVGDTATAYEPYKPITETDISFPSPVYGGILSVVSGVIRVQWAGFSATWGDGESATDMGEGITRKVFPMVDYLQTGQANNMCNIAPYSANENASVHFYYSGSGATNRKCRLFLPSDTPDSTEITVVTKLSQFYEVQLTPSQITALVGNNTLWSDADGQMSAVFFKKA